MAVCTPSGGGQQGGDGDRNGAGTRGGAATGSNDRTSGTASLPARTARPGRRRRAASPSRRPPPDHPPAVPGNRDASLFRAAAPHPAGQRRRRRNLSPASPDTGPSGQHASADPARFVASAGPLRAASGGVPVQRNRHRSKSARDRSSGTRRLGSRTARTRTDGQSLGRSARHRRLGVDERRPRQDTRPACLLSGTVWGAAAEQNCQILFGAVLTLKSGRCLPACRGARCNGDPSSSSDAAHRTSAPMTMSQRHPDGLRLPHSGATRGTAGDNDRQDGNRWVNSSEQTRVSSHEH